MFTKLILRLVSILSCILLFSFPRLMAQQPADPGLYPAIMLRDSLLFEEAFNRCNMAVLDTLLAGDMEFYHDQGGIIRSKTAFVESMRSGICALPYKATRELDAGSMELFPLKNKDTLYGVIQLGTHRFYGEDSNGKKLTSTATFSHLWLLKGGSWQLSRVFSYNHR